MTDTKLNERTHCPSCGNGEEDYKFVACYDNADTHAHNVYNCDNCGSVTVDRVWQNKGYTIISKEGTLVAWSIIDIEDIEDLVEHYHMQAYDVPQMQKLARRFLATMADSQLKALLHMYVELVAIQEEEE